MLASRAGLVRGRDGLLNRRAALVALGSSAALPWIQACRGAQEAPPVAPRADTPAREEAARALLDACGERLLALFPETATSLGIDTGPRAALRAQLADRSEAGTQRIAAQVRADLERVQAFDVTGLSPATRTSLDVVRSAYATALEGFALPYGDITVGNWRNTPYVVIQNVGAYLDVPRFLDSDHRIATPADAEAYLERLRSCARQLDGERERVQAARASGLVPPSFLLDKAIAQLTLSVQQARKGGTLVESIARRTKDIPGDWAAQAATIVRQDVAPALERQIVELRAQRRSRPTPPASRRGPTARRSTGGR